MRVVVRILMVLALGLLKALRETESVQPVQKQRSKFAECG
jgi:hypothetical protein